MELCWENCFIRKKGDPAMWWLNLGLGTTTANGKPFTKRLMVEFSLSATRGCQLPFSGSGCQLRLGRRRCCCDSLFWRFPKIEIGNCPLSTRREFIKEMCTKEKWNWIIGAILRLTGWPEETLVRWRTTCSLGCVGHGTKDTFLAVWATNYRFVGRWSLWYKSINDAELDYLSKGTPRF